MATKTKKQADELIDSVVNNDVVIDPVIPNEPEKFQARVTRLAPNKKFVYGALDGMQIEIFMPRHRERSAGRVITVVRAEELGENKFKVLQ